MHCARRSAQPNVITPPVRGRLCSHSCASPLSGHGSGHALARYRFWTFDMKHGYSHMMNVGCMPAQLPKLGRTSACFFLSFQPGAQFVTRRSVNCYVTSRSLEGSRFNGLYSVYTRCVGRLGPHFNTSRPMSTVSSTIRPLFPCNSFVVSNAVSCFGAAILSLLHASHLRISSFACFAQPRSDDVFLIYGSTSAKEPPLMIGQYYAEEDRNTVKTTASAMLMECPKDAIHSIYHISSEKPFRTEELSLRKVAT